MRNHITNRERRLLDQMLSAFLWLGPIETLEWFAGYFQKTAQASRAHGHPASWCEELVADVKGLVGKYKDIAKTTIQRCSQCGYVGPLD